MRILTVVFASTHNAPFIIKVLLIWVILEVVCVNLPSELNVNKHTSEFYSLCISIQKELLPIAEYNELFSEGIT